MKFKKTKRPTITTMYNVCWTISSLYYYFIVLLLLPLHLRVDVVEWMGQNAMKFYAKKYYSTKWFILLDCFIFFLRKFVVAVAAASSLLNLNLNELERCNSNNSNAAERAHNGGGVAYNLIEMRGKAIILSNEAGLRENKTFINGPDLSP